MRFSVYTPCCFIEPSARRRHPKVPHLLRSWTGRCAYLAHAIVVDRMRRSQRQPQQARHET